MLFLMKLEAVAPNVWAWPVANGEQAKFIAFYKTASFQTARFFMDIDSAKSYAMNGRDV